MSDFDEISSEPRWYVVHTYSGYENKVKANLEKIIDNRNLHDVIQEIKIPVATTVEKTKDGEEKVKEEKLFPSYVFVKMLMSDATWHVVRNIRGCTGFVGPGSRPVPLTDSEISSFELETIVKDLVFEVGDTVTIKSGTLQGNTAKVIEISENKDKIKVLISMFGRELPFEIDANSAERVDY